MLSSRIIAYQTRIRPMLRFKRFETAAITISGIELAAKIRKHRFKTGKLGGRPETVSDVWATILAARPPRYFFLRPSEALQESLHRRLNFHLDGKSLAFSLK